MGIYLFLHIDPTCIKPAQWAHAYDDALRLLQSYPSQLMGITEQELFAVKLAVHVRRLEHHVDDPYERCWQVAGDFQSKRYGEAFAMYRDLARYSMSEPSQIHSHTHIDDILLDESAVQVFGGKTGGKPYHIPLLAAAMMVESRFPRAALVSGTMNRPDVEAAQEYAQTILGEPVTLPVCMNGPALWARLVALDACDALEGPLLDIFQERFCGEEHETYIALFSCVSGRRREEHLRALLLQEDTSLSPATAPSHAILLAWLEVTGDLDILFALSCMDDRGPCYTPDKVVSALADMWHAVSNEERDKVDTGQILERTPPQNIPGLLAALLASRYARGLSPHMRMAPAAVEAALARVFGSDSARLAGLLHAEIAQHRARMSDLGGMIVRAANLPQRDSLEALQEMVIVASPDELSSWQRQHVLYLAYGVHRLLRRHPELAGAAADLTACRQQIAQGLAHGRLVLTEDAWAWIADEDDPAMLQVLLAMALMQALPEPVYSVRRAVLENRALCRLVADLVGDPAVMARVVPVATGESQPAGYRWRQPARVTGGKRRARRARD